MEHGFRARAEVPPRRAGWKFCCFAMRRWAKLERGGALGQVQAGRSDCRAKRLATSNEAGSRLGTAMLEKGHCEAQESSTSIFYCACSSCWFSLLSHVLGSRSCRLTWVTSRSGASSWAGGLGGCKGRRAEHEVVGPRNPLVAWGFEALVLVESKWEPPNHQTTNPNHHSWEAELVPRLVENH